MWNRPQLMKDVSDLLYVAGAAALLVALVVWLARLPMFPVREVVVLQELHEVHRNEIKRSLAGQLRGNFFSVNLEAVRKSLEELPWVRRAEARRQWPSSIEVDIEEHVPVAYWGQATGQLVNSHGEIFAAEMKESPATPMPVLVGPHGFVQEMVAYYQQSSELLKPIGRTTHTLSVSPRLALQLKLDDGMIVELGRQQTKAPISERLERFVAYYPTVLTAAKKRPSVVDMRYPKGFALRANALAAASESESKGKP